MSAELNNEQEQSGQQSVDDYAAAFNEAAAEVKPEDKETSQDDDSGSWIPEEEGGREGDAAKRGDGSKDEYTPETIDTENPPEALKDHPYYKSMKGRVDRERRRADELEARLRAVESEKPKQQSQPMQFEKAEIPEDLKEDVEAFKKAYPEYADVIEMKGKTGDRIRKLLYDYGGEVAAVQADNFILMSEVRASRAEVSKKISEYEGMTFEQHIYKDHPDFGKLSKEGKHQFLDNIKDWIEDQPLKDARKWERIYDTGTAAELSELFTEFKNSQNKNNQSQRNNQNDKRRQAIDDGLAVPSSARGIRKPPAKSREDYAGAFEEACAS